MRLKILGLVFVLVVSLAPLSKAAGPYNQDPGDPGPGGAGCIRECYTTCTGPAGVECCCYYHCSTGTSYGCTNNYCPGTSRSCFR